MANEILPNADAGRLDRGVMALRAGAALQLLQRETQRLHEQAEFHRARLAEARADIGQLQDEYSRLRDACADRRRAIVSRWQARATIRKLRESVKRMEPFSLPGRAGGVRQVVRTRVHELCADLLAAAQPIPQARKESGVYALFDDARCVYVGQSVNVVSRLAQHIGEKRFTHASYVAAPTELLSDLERLLINALMPEMNKDPATRAARSRLAP